MAKVYLINASQAPASFIIDFAAQQYGIFSTPNMKDINDRNISFFSPHPYFIAGFFGPQQLLQLTWLYRLWKMDPKKPAERGELDIIVDYVPYYALGNLCIACMYFAVRVRLRGAKKLTLPNSMDDFLELRTSRHLSGFCYCKYLRPNFLPNRPPSANEYIFHKLHTHTCRRQDLCWYWSSRLPSQWCRCFSPRRASNFSN